MSYVPDRPCQFSPYGTGCGGTRLTGVDVVQGTGHVITLNVTGAFPNAPVAMVFGDRRVQFPLIGHPGCELLANPLVLINLFANPNGNVSLTTPVRGRLSGQVTIQALPFGVGPGGRLLLRASNGLLMDCGR